MTHGVMQTYTGIQIQGKCRSRKDDLMQDTEICKNLGRSHKKSLQRLQKKKVYYDSGPWGALVMPLAEINQEEVPQWEFMWRLCISYGDINSITRIFKLPLQLCKVELLHNIK